MQLCCFLEFKGPGPGSYDIKSTIGSGVASSIRGRQPVPSSEYLRLYITAEFSNMVAYSVLTSQLYTIPIFRHPCMYKTNIPN